MAFYTGYQIIPITTYLAFKNTVAGNGYDADGYYGDQCWDLAAEFWYNAGFGKGYPKTGSNHSAYECWTVNKEVNAGDKFDLIYNLEDVNQGDVVVFNQSSLSSTGHIGFADADYSGNATLAILGQNQGTTGLPIPIVNPAGGTTANVTSIGTADFLGAFRYKAWHDKPTPTPNYKKSKFPWVLYSRKLNHIRNM